MKFAQGWIVFQCFNGEFRESNIKYNIIQNKSDALFPNFKMEVNRADFVLI